MKQRLSSWVIKPLNLPSRLVLLKFVLQEMPIYLFSILLAPKFVLHEIKSLQRNFHWGGREAKSKFSLVSWEGIFWPKDQGGLGLRAVEVMAEFQGGKVWWGWVNYSSEPWARLWHTRYAIAKPKYQLVCLNDDQTRSPIWRKSVEEDWFTITISRRFEMVRVLIYGRIPGIRCPS